MPSDLRTKVGSGKKRVVQWLHERVFLAEYGSYERCLVHGFGGGAVEVRWFGGWQQHVVVAAAAASGKTTIGIQNRLLKQKPFPVSYVKLQQVWIGAWIRLTENLPLNHERVTLGFWL